MKKYLVAALLAAFVLALAGCGSNSAASSSSASDSSASASASVSASESSAADDAAADADEPEEGDQGVSIDWQPVATAEEAATAAGCNGFSVMDEVTLGDITFTDPTFSHADGVAQAVYEQPACMVYVRKATGVYGAPLSDRSYDEFAHTWTQNHKGLEITCYGAEEGAATLIQWNVGDDAYAATYQGLGGDEMTMDPDDITSLVSGIQ
ncbi:MAG: hypothetical protein Q3963_08625 [Coriobacteriaceae bacterium]|nr:hypothetical protein [Coriobacteriaceae bacterium]